jgi:DNA-binding transcriptional ArsR family regulator
MMNDGTAIPNYYRYYEQVNKNGKIYDITIDNGIINQLNINETETSGKLKLATEKLIGRVLSPDTFYSHLDVLVKCKILTKTDRGRGKDVLYSLTENAKKLLQLNLLGDDWKKIKLFNRIYERFFLSELLNDPLLILKTEEEFDSFLCDLEVKRDNLEWGTICTADYGYSLDLVYENTQLSESLHKRDLGKFWKEKEELTTVYDKLVFFCFPKRPHNTDIMVHRNEYWQINKNSPHRLQRIEYAAIIPGISIDDVVSGRTPKLSYADVEEAFDLLKQANIIEPAFRFRGKLRYKVKDDNEKLHTGLDLRNFLSIVKAFHDEEHGLLTFKWKLFEGPTDDERKRWTWILGEKEANRLFRVVELKRYENRTGMRQCKNTLEYHRFLNSICPEEFVSPSYGPWPYSSFLYDFRRKREEEKREEKEREKERILKEDPDRKWIRKGERRWAMKKKRRITKKEVANDKMRYEQHLKKKLEAQIEHLPINVENEGIKDFRIFFSVTLQKYPFLYQIMRYICPGIFKFELTDEEVETGRAYNEIERWKTENLYRSYSLSQKRE